MNFIEWENQVNILMLEEHGVGIDDIPDMPWHYWFKDDLSAKEAIDLAIGIVNEGGF